MKPDLKEIVAQAQKLHNDYCIDLLLGAKMAAEALELLNINPMRQNQDLHVIAEDTGCFVDALQAATDTSFGNGTLSFKPYGKEAATFWDKKSRKAVRVAASGRSLAKLLHDTALSHNLNPALPESHLEIIEQIPMDKYLKLETVKIDPEPERKDDAKVFCDRCKEPVSASMVIARGTKLFCPSCLQGTYYHRDWESQFKGPAQAEVEPPERHWSKTKIACYNRALISSEFPASVMHALEAHLDKDTTVLDVGAGVGALALLFALRVKSVTTVEPDPVMLETLKANISEQGIENITVLPQNFETLEIEPHDIVICSNLLYPGAVKQPRLWVEKLQHSARKLAAIILRAGDPREAFGFKALQSPLHLESPATANDYIYLYQLLHDMGIYAEIRMLEYNFNQAFKDIDEALQFFKELYKLETTEAQELTAAYLLNTLEPDKDRYCYKSLQRSALIQWQP